jgi:hypothetical protein
MIPRFSDIVTITARQDGVRWVLTPSASPSHNHVPNVRLIRHAPDGNWQMHTCKANELTVLERPTFEIGEHVTINGRGGVVIELKDEVARVRWNPRRLPLQGGGALRDQGGESDVEIWHLAFNNRLSRGELA